MDRSVLIDRLRELFIFELVDDDEFDWLADASEVLEVDGGTEIIEYGSAPEGWFVLLEGELAIERDVNGVRTIVATADQPGVWAGAIPYVDDESSTAFAVRCTVDSLVLHLPEDRFVELVRRGIPVFHHLLRGVRDGTLNYTQRVSNEERLASLGRLSAGLAHELNNPAAAAQRGAAGLRSAIWDLQSAAVMLVISAGASEQLRARLEEIERQLLEAAAETTPLSPLERSSAEDEVLDALDDAGVPDADDLVEALVDSGVDGQWLERIVVGEPPVEPGPLIYWIAQTARVRQLIAEIDIAAGRISDLVGSIKTYSYMDRSGAGPLDVNAGLDATLAVLRHKLRSGVEVVRDYDVDLPQIDGHAGELNQVWTNLIDNAWDAMDGTGTLTIRTSRGMAPDTIRVEIADSGPGVPTEERARIFDPFFTTKGVGEGSGLGLDIVRRIVVEAHRGTIAVEEPAGGGAAFVVTLPLAHTDG